MHHFLPFREDLVCKKKKKGENEKEMLQKSASHSCPRECYGVGESAVLDGAHWTS